MGALPAITAGMSSSKLCAFVFPRQLVSMVPVNRGEEEEDFCNSDIDINLNNCSPDQNSIYCHPQ